MHPVAIILPSGNFLDAGWLTTAPTTLLDDEIATLSTHIHSLRAYRYRNAPHITHLPPEILGPIFGQVDLASLRECALTTSLFLPLVREHLFYHRTVLSRHIPKFVLSCREAPHLCAYVRELGSSGTSIARWYGMWPPSTN